NAQGKTNLLEALYVAATGKSFRHARSADLIQHAATTATVQARFQRHGVRHEIEAVFSGRQRQLRIDGRNLRQRTKLLELVNVVAFFPDDLRIVKGSPEERRSFLDRALANHRADFVDATVAYLKALRSRNVLLKQERAPERALLEVYE